MRNYWLVSLQVSFVVHALVLLGPPSLRHATKKINEQIKEIQIFPKKIERIHEVKTPTKNDVSLKRPPPYLNKVFDKVALDSKRDFAFANKTQVLDETIKKVVLSETPQEEKLKGSPDYMDYYRSIRQTIRANAYRYYTMDVSGTVVLTFSIAKNGKLKSYTVDKEHSTGHKDLISITIRSLKEATPFPVFPEALDSSELPFNLTVHFKSD